MFIPGALIQDVKEAKPGSKFRINRTKNLWAYTVLPSAPVLVKWPCPGLFNSFFSPILGIFVSYSLGPSGSEHGKAKPHSRKALLVLIVAHWAPQSLQK